MHAQARPRGPGPEPLPPAFVVEDDATVAHLLGELATSVGLQPRHFTRLADARRAIHEGAPAVLVIDDDLPDGRGGDFVRELKADPRTENMPVVMCTSAGPVRRRQISRLVPVVHKPFDVSEMEEVLRRLALGAPV